MCLLSFAMVCLPRSIFAQGQTVEVHALSPALVEAEPGEILSLSFRVENRTNAEQEFREELVLPEGCRIILPLFDFTLGPQSETIRLIVFQVGRSVPAGNHPVSYSVSGRSDYALGDRAVTQISVRAVHDLSFLLEDSPPDMVVAGEPFRFTARLINRGNEALSLKINVNPPAGGQASLEPSSLSLSGGESRLLEVVATADSRERRMIRRHIRITALADTTVDDRKISARLTVSFAVVPMVSGEDRYVRYPLALSTRMGGETGDNQVLQFELEGSGYLDEARQKRLDFSVRGPDRHNRGVFGKRDEYQAHYGEPGFTISAGDRSYGLSPLTSWSRYGRGMGVDFHPADSFVGGGIYHVQDRWRLQTRKDTAGYIRVAPLPEVSLQINLLALDYDPWQDEHARRDRLLSLQGNSRFRGHDAFEAEIGLSESDGGKATGRDAAWRIDYRGGGPNGANYVFSGRRAGRDYAGRYSDSAHYSGALSVPLNPSLRGAFSLRRYEGNLDRIAARGGAPRETLYQGGFDVRLPSQWRLSARYEHHDRCDRFSGPAPAVQEQRIRLGFGRSAGSLGYRAEVRREWTEEKTGGKASAGWHCSLNVVYNPFRSLNFTFHGSHNTRKSTGETYLVQQGQTLGGSMNWQPSQNLSLQVNYARQEQQFPNISPRERIERDNFSAALRYRLPNNHRLDFHLRRSDGNQTESRTHYVATYTMPISLPLGRKQSVGTVAGRVYLSGEPNEPGMADVVLYADGTAARTDKEGVFLFNTLTPGTYQLRLEETTTGGEYVPAQPSQGTVVVTGGATSEVEIPLVKSGRLSGKVIVLSKSPTRLPGETSAPDNGGNDHLSIRDRRDDTGGGGLGNVLLELSRAGEQRRTVSNKEGAFLFDRLAPGEWTLTLHPHTLPAHHSIEAAEQPVLIKPGVTLETILPVLPRVRTIRMVDEGTIGPGTPR